MNVALALLLTLIGGLGGSELYASGLGDLTRAAGSGRADTLFAPPSRPEPLLRDGSAAATCWRRGKEPAADRLNLPGSLCVTSMRITADLDSAPKLELTGEGLNGLYDLRIGPGRDGLFLVTAVVLERIPLIMVCAPAEAAYIEFSVLADERGKIVSDPELRSFRGVTPDTCSSPWDYRETGYFTRY